MDLYLTLEIVNTLSLTSKGRELIKEKEHIYLSEELPIECRLQALKLKAREATLLVTDGEK